MARFEHVKGKANPCIRCGQKPRLALTSWGLDGFKHSSVCRNCHIITPSAPDKTQARAIWNLHNPKQTVGTARLRLPPAPQRSNDYD